MGACVAKGEPSTLLFCEGLDYEQSHAVMAFGIPAFIALIKLFRSPPDIFLRKTFAFPSKV